MGSNLDFLPNKMVGAFLSEMDCEDITGHAEKFNTLVHAMWTMEKIQKLEEVQPHLAWKPLEVIKHTLEATTQWARPTVHFPMKDHHAACFPFDNMHHLQEEVAMDTIFMDVKGWGNVEVAQLFFGLMSRMMNENCMSSKEKVHVIKACKDFCCSQGCPSCPHWDLAPEQMCEEIIDWNQKMMIRDSWSEAGNPNQNPIEANCICVLKAGIKSIMARTKAPKASWPCVLKCLCDINNHCAQHQC